MLVTGKSTNYKFVSSAGRWQLEFDIWCNLTHFFMSFFSSRINSNGQKEKENIMLFLPIFKIHIIQKKELKWVFFGVPGISKSYTHIFCVTCYKIMYIIFKFKYNMKWISLWPLVWSFGAWSFSMTCVGSNFKGILYFFPVRVYCILNVQCTVQLNYYLQCDFSEDARHLKLISHYFHRLSFVSFRWIVNFTARHHYLLYFIHLTHMK